MIADLPRLVVCLQRMADNNESPPPDYFKLWKLQMIANAKLRVDIHALKDELESCKDQMAGMVERTNAKHVAKQAFTLGQLKGKKRAGSSFGVPVGTRKNKTLFRTAGGIHEELHLQS